MSSAILRLVTLSNSQCRAWSRLSLGLLSNHVPKRGVQEFPGTRLDNSSHRDHLLILPENLNDPNNELLRIPKIGEHETNFKKINVESAYKGLSQAICTFENFLTDRENVMDDPYKDSKEMFKDIEKHLFPLDTAYNLMMVMILVDVENYSYKEINLLLKRYFEVREKRFTGVFERSIKHINPNDANIDQSDMKILNFYRSQLNCPIGKRPVDDSTIFELKKNLKNDMDLFRQCLHGANSMISHTVDDPDILAAVANEYNDCQDLHHKERTPLRVTAMTYHKFMKVCPDRFVRRMLWETYNKRCSPKALPRFNTTSLQTSIRTARRKIADLSGYRSHLDFKLCDSMARKKDNILVSLDSINKENMPKLADRLQELNDFAYDNHFDDPVGLGIQEYDVDYWSHKYIYDVLIGMNQHQVTSYFPLKSVLHGIQNFFIEYLSVEITMNDKDSDRFWSPEVQVFELKRNGQHLGNINFDPFQNGTRKATSAVYGRMRTKFPGGSHIPTRLISAPYKIDPSTKAAHLTITDAVNLFHCFVVVLQRLLYNYKYYELNTYGALENDVLNVLPYLCDAHLITNHKLMQSLSSRGSQSKPIDSELASRISKSFHYFRPLKIWNELYKAHLDLELHSVMTSSKSLAEEIYKIYSPFERSSENFDHCAMADIFVGPHDGTKYADLWARQLAIACLARATDSDSHLNEDKMKELYSSLIDNLFDPNNFQTESKLVSLLGGDVGFESMKSGLGVL